MRLTLAAMAAALVLIGCGGGGGFLGTNADASISASPNPASFGIPVTVTWKTLKALKIESSNFGLGRSDLNGSITDNPGVTTTYQFTAEVQNEDHAPISVTKAVTLTVPRSTRSILIVGDAAVSGPNQVRDSLSTITSGAVTVSASMPSSTSVQAVVLHSSANLTAADRPKLDALLAAGKSVVFINESVSKISGGSISSIGGVLAGATAFSGSGSVPLNFRAEAGPVPISITVRGRPVSKTSGFLRGVSTSADRLLASSGGTYTSAMAYKVPTGGRTAFLGHDGVGSDAGSQSYNAALLVIVRWCLDGA